MPSEEVADPSRDVEMLQSSLPASVHPMEHPVDPGIVKSLKPSDDQKLESPHSPRVIYDIETDEHMDTSERQMEDRILAMDLYYTYDKEIPSKQLQKDKEIMRETLRKVTAKKAKKTSKTVDQQINVQMDDYGLDFVRPDLSGGSSNPDFPPSNLYAITDLDPFFQSAQNKTNQDDLFEEIKEEQEGD